jgi:hypothetical protein
VVSGAVGELLFQSDWRNVLSGAVVRGGVMRVRYAPERMQSIVRGATVSGIPYFAARYHCYGYGCCSYAYDTRAHVRFRPDQPFSDEPIGDRALEYAVPPDATRVEIFFHTDVTTSTWYCGDESRKATQGPDRFYDSNYGANYQLSLP